MIETYSEADVSKIVEDYNTIASKTKERQTVKDFDIRLLNKVLDDYRVIISARKTLGYEPTYGRDDDWYKPGKGNATILPNRKGEIIQIDIPPKNATYKPYIEEMVWYTGKWKEENIKMIIEEEDRFEDLLVYRFLPRIYEIFDKKYRNLTFLFTISD